MPNQTSPSSTMSAPALPQAMFAVPAPARARGERATRWWLAASLLVCGLMGGLGFTWHGNRESGRDWAEHAEAAETALAQAEQLAAIGARLDKLREDRASLQRKRVALLAQMVELSAEADEGDEIQKELDAVDEPPATTSKPRTTKKSSSKPKATSTAKPKTTTTTTTSTSTRPRIDLRGSDDPLAGI